jgi:hypothetical protein
MRRTPARPGFYHAEEVETSMMLALRREAKNLCLVAAWRARRGI